MKAIHHFLDGSLPIPPVDVENVDVCSSQLLQAGFYTNMHRLDIVSGIEDLLLDPSLCAHKIRCVLCTRISTGPTGPMGLLTLVAMTS